MARRSYRCWTLVVRLLLAAAAACQAYRPLEQPGHGGRRALGEGHGMGQLPLEPSPVCLGQGKVVPPASPTNGSSSGGGGGSYILFPGFLPVGTALGLPAAANVLGSVGECEAACRRNTECNLFWFCEAEAGCAHVYRNYSAPTGGCQLVDQQLSQQETGRPPEVLDAPGFVGGAPIRITADPVDGYDMMLGVGLLSEFDYSCPGSMALGNASCVLAGSPAELAARCDADPSCRAMSYYPSGRDYLGLPATVFRGGPGGVSNDTLLAAAVFNQNTVLYVKRAPPPAPPAGGGTLDSDGRGGGGLSSGAVAGIIIGACAVVGLLAGAAALFVRRRRLRRLAVQQKAEVDQWAKWAAEPASVGGWAARRPRMVHCPPPPPPTEASGGGSVAGGGGARSPGGGRASGSGSWGRRRLWAEPGGARLAAPEAAGLLRGPECSGHWEGEFVPLGDWPSGEGGGPEQQQQQQQQQRRSHIPAISFCTDEQGAYEELGRGACSTVYRVLVDGERPHAAKVLCLRDDPSAAHSFLQEASLLRALRHKNIVGYVGARVSQGSAILLMELLEGGDLRSRLGERASSGDGGRTFAWHARGGAVALDVASALAFLHSRGLSYYDLKSRSVLLDAEGTTAKLADVGLARAGLQAPQRSSSGDTLGGTLDYMAPELLEGHAAGHSADVFSFGVLLWEICTGEHPICGGLREINVPSECPQAVADLFLQCTHEDPSQRPTAQQVVDALTQLQQGAAASNRLAVQLPSPVQAASEARCQDSPQPPGLLEGGEQEEAQVPAGTAAPQQEEEQGSCDSSPSLTHANGRLRAANGSEAKGGAAAQQYGSAAVPAGPASADGSCEEGLGGRAGPEGPLCTTQPGGSSSRSSGSGSLPSEDGAPAPASGAHSSQRRGPQLPHIRKAVLGSGGAASLWQQWAQQGGDWSVLHQPAPQQQQPGGQRGQW